MKHGRFNSRLRILLLALAVLPLAGCAWLFAPRVQLDEITLDVAPRANDDTPLAVDFVAVDDPDLFKLLSSVNARQWFSEREQYHRDYRTQFSVWSLELVPGQLMQVQDFPFSGRRSAGLLVFAGYNTPGAHRLRLDEQSRVWLRFDSREMRLMGDDGR